jgi:EF hand
MRTILPCFLLLVTAPLDVAEADVPTDQQKAKRPMPPFISPAGKPYRSEDGEPYAKAEWFAVLDADQNGELSIEDFVTEAEAFFAELDVDADGRIAWSEITRYEQVVAPEVQAGFTPAGAGGMRPPPDMPIPRGSGGGPPGGGPPGGMGGGPPPGMGGGPSKAMLKKLANMPQGAGRFAILGMPQPVMAADGNMNGSVTIEEMRAAAVQRFGWLNNMGNGDGKLDWNELPETPIEDMMNLSKKDKKKKDKEKDDEKPLAGQRQPIP